MMSLSCARMVLECLVLYIMAVLAMVHTINCEYTGVMETL